MICNNFGNAITKFPEAIHSDNLEKAIYYYNEALSIRTATLFPFERALTLLNYLEALWFLNLANKNGSSAGLYQQMLDFAAEARSLTNEEGIMAEAENHLQKLQELGETLAQEQL